MKGLLVTGSLLLSLATQAQAPQELYAQHCSSCHNSDGSGIEGLAPPLLNAELWEKLDMQAGLYLVGVMSSGMSGKLHINGRDYVGMVMPPVMLSYQEKAAIAGHVLELNGLSNGAATEETDMPLLSRKTLRAMRSDPITAAPALALE